MSLLHTLSPADTAMSSQYQVGALLRQSILIDEEDKERTNFELLVLLSFPPTIGESISTLSHMKPNTMQ